MRSTNFLTRLLTGIKEENAKKEAKMASSLPTSALNVGPAWKKAEDIDDELQLGAYLNMIFLYIN